MISPGQVLNRPSERSMLNSGFTSEISGNIAISSDTPMSRPLPGKCSRAIAYAAMVASMTEITVEISPIPIELISGRTNCAVWNIPEKFDHDHWLGQKLPSVSVCGALNARATSHQIGNRVHAMVIALVTPQLILRPVGLGGRPVRVRAAIRAPGAPAAISASLQCGAGRGCAKHPDEYEGDDRHGDEDQHRDG